MPDSLTGLEERAAFLEALARARQAAEVAVVLVRVDHLDVTDRQAGVRALKGVAAALSAGLRRGDEAFRIDRDEFAAIVAVTETGEAVVAGRRLRASVTRAGTVPVSVAVVVPQGSESDDALVARAARSLLAERSGPLA
jgi:diguanylate cyclase (GGDEF)-like protein